MYELYLNNNRSERNRTKGQKFIMGDIHLPKTKKPQIRNELRLSNIFAKSIFSPRSLTSLSWYNTSLYSLISFLTCYVSNPFVTL